MKVETFYPRDERLKSCIDYYYFLKSDSPAFISEYYVFPHTLQALNIHKNIQWDIDVHSVKVSGIKKNNFALLLQGKFETPLYVKLAGKINKITIAFKPLGLNHFIGSPFSAIASMPTQHFTEWDHHDKHTDFLDQFFTELNNSKRIDLLEKYLLLHYQAPHHVDEIRKSLPLLSNFDEELSVEEIANTLQLTTRTFNRLFKTQMGISPIGYRKITRFRHSLKNKLFNAQFKKLTEIGYESNFYDQSYFIKMYNKLTNTSPTEFFKSIDKIADNQFILKFINRVD